MYSTTSPRASDCPRKQGEELLAKARAGGDKTAEATALTDLGIMSLSEADYEGARAVLEDALTLARELGDRALETDILGNLGLALLALRDYRAGVQLLEQELAYARAGDDPYAEKASLERLGLVRARLGEPAAGLRCLERALYLARTVRDRQHQAKLLWQLAIMQAEQGQRPQAIGRAEEAIALLESMAYPEAQIYRDYFGRYRAGAPGMAAPDHAMVVLAAVPVSPVGPKNLQSTAVLGTENGVPLLRQALAAVKSLTRFAGSGFKTASVELRQRRLAACASCPQHTGLRCRACGCFTELKARLAHEQCPSGNWPA